MEVLLGHFIDSASTKKSTLKKDNVDKSHWHFKYYLPRLSSSYQIIFKNLLSISIFYLTQSYKFSCNTFRYSISSKIHVLFDLN